MAHEHSVDRRLRLALGANVAIVVVELAVGVAAASLGLIADAAHNLADVSALSLALWARVLTRRAPTGARSFGWHRSTVLAAQVNAAAVLVLTGLLLVESVRRLNDPPEVSGGLVLAAAGAAFVVNGGSALLLRHHAHDLGTRGALLHLAGDAAASLAVAVSGAVVLAGGSSVVDPLASLLLCALLTVGAWRLLRRTTVVLLEGTPTGLDPDAVSATIAGVPGVESVHDLHVWSLSGAVHALSAHVVVAGHPTLEEAQVVGTAVKAAVSAPYAIVHATVELECEGCVDDGSWCAITR